MYSTYKQLCYSYQFAGIKRKKQDYIQKGAEKEWRINAGKQHTEEHHHHHPQQQQQQQQQKQQHQQQRERSPQFPLIQRQTAIMTEKLSIGRRRTLNRIVAGNSLLSRKQVHDSSRHASDATSDMLNKSNISNANVKLENTYQIGPVDNEKFDSTRVEKAMKDVLESRLSDMEYDREQSILIAKELASEIQHRIKIFQWKRFKLVCHVTIGQNTRQGVQVVSRCVWDDKVDNYSCVRYNNKSLFAVAQCYGVYFE